MNHYEEAASLAELISKANNIVVLQADNPDGDSLASSLALEHILGDLHKNVTLYCGAEIPSYLRYLPGWDRITKDMPKSFDLSIIVDTSTKSLFENLDKNGQMSWLTNKPCVIIDHHQSTDTLDFADLVINKPAVSTSEIIYELALQLNWPLNIEAKSMIAVSILSDSLGLMSEATSARSIHIIAELVESGVRLAKLDNDRKELMRKSPEILSYKGQLLGRIEYYANNRIAIVVIPWEEIERYSPYYNPSILVLDEMRLVKGVDVAIAIKYYPDGKITGKIRTNYGKDIAGNLAMHFGGGGHPYASGFKITKAQPLQSVKDECIAEATRLLDNKT